LQRLEVTDREDPFASVIRCTADQAQGRHQRVRGSVHSMRGAS
jgi:hypothetical protein